MSKKDQDNKFKEELEKELESGLHLNADGGEGNDFTVKVRREEYIVKRRFYDKDKALEEAKTLRKDKRNLVEDNIEGQAFSSEEDYDEKVDWDKLVDAGLVFDPPIAQAAEKKPHEPPIGLSDQLVPKKVADDRELEKTLVVKRPKQVPSPEPELEAEEEEGFEFEGEEVLTQPKEKKGMMWVAILGVVLAIGGASYYFFTTRTPGKSPVETPAQTQKIMPVKPIPIAKAPEENIPAAAPVTAEVKKDVKPVETKPMAVVAPPPKTAPVEVKKPEQKVAVQEPAKPKEAPKPAPEPKPVSYDIEDHFTHTVHVSSYRTPDRARNAVAQLRKKGIMACSGIISIPGKGEWYRVYAGYLKDLDSASALAERIKSDLREDAVARKTPLVIQIGETAPSDQIGQLFTQLEKKGYDVNAVPIAPKSSVVRILTGAFKSEDEAATMVSFLKKDGFSARVVQR